MNGYTYNSDFVVGIDSFISQTTFICTCNQTHYMVLLDVSPTLSLGLCLMLTMLTDYCTWDI